MKLEFVKNFIRIDVDEDDEYIELLIKVAEEYIIGAIGKCDMTKVRIQILMLNIIASLYENRSFAVDKVNEKAQYAIATMIFQLQLEAEE